MFFSFSLSDTPVNYLGEAKYIDEVYKQQHLNIWCEKEPKQHLVLLSHQSFIVDPQKDDSKGHQETGCHPRWDCNIL